MCQYFHRNYLKHFISNRFPINFRFRCNYTPETGHSALSPLVPHFETQSQPIFTAFGQLVICIQPWGKQARWRWQRFLLWAEILLSCLAKRSSLNLILCPEWSLGVAPAMFNHHCRVRSAANNFQHSNSRFKKNRSSVFEKCPKIIEVY